MKEIMFNLTSARKFLTSCFLAGPYIHILQIIQEQPPGSTRTAYSLQRERKEEEQLRLFYDSLKIKIPLQHEEKNWTQTEAEAVKI